MILAYFSPDVVLPVASVFAAAVGFVMMVGRAPFRLAVRGFRSGVAGLKKIFAKWNL
jgi:hypothetical protein